MDLRQVVELSASVSATSSRSSKITLLAGLLRSAAPGEVELAVDYLTGRLPQGRIGLGGAALSAARPLPARAPSLTLRDIDAAFAAVAGASGPGSTREKGRLLHDLLARATSEEQSFLYRLIAGELRQGALEGVMADAVARASGIAPEKIRRAVMSEGRLDRVARLALHEGEEALGGLVVQLSQPVRPMLAQTAGTVEEALTRLGEMSLEYKLDGARVQVHKDGEEVRVFSRALREVTPAVPEVVEIVRAFPARSAILDGEAIALKEDGTPHPFQVTMRRFGRKLEVERLREELPLSLFLFDLLYLDGRPLIDEPYAARTADLSRQAPGSLVVPRLVTGDPAAAQAFLSSALEAGHEGVMAKDPASAYEAGNRGSAWLKLKAAQTLDLAVLAAEWGHGRRQGWLSNLHLGARDPEHGAFVMLGKTFKGMTDEMLAWQTEKLLALEIGRDSYTVYVRPELVVEIAFGDVQASPRYPGGLALRFARVKRYRTDKTAEEADTIERVREIHLRPGTGGPMAGGPQPPG